MTMEAAEGVQQFLSYVTDVLNDKIKTVDLFKVTSSAGKIGATPSIKVPGAPQFSEFSGGKVCILIDGETCLDRLYGGYYSDWCCGGQWNRVLEYLTQLMTAINRHDMAVVVVLDGTMHVDRHQQWKDQQVRLSKKVRDISQHIRRKHTPPSKASWLSPRCLHSCLRFLLPSFGVTVLQTVIDHKLEVMSFLRTNHVDVLVAESAEYLLMRPPRFMFASTMKLTFKGPLEVNELLMNDVWRNMDINPECLGLVATLLGNHIISAEDLKPLHDELLIHVPEDQKSVSDLESIANFVFSSFPEDQRRRKTQKFVKSVKYYQNATNLNFPPEEYDVIAELSAIDSLQLAEKDSAKFAAGERNRVEAVGATISAQLVNSSCSAGAETMANAVQHSAANGRNSAGSEGVAPSGSLTNEQSEPRRMPVVLPDVLKAAKQRHCRAMLHPWIYQILTKAEICIDVGFECCGDDSVPLSFIVWRPMRQYVYAVLFDLNHKAYCARRDGHYQPPTGDPSAGGHTSPDTRIFVREWTIDSRSSAPMVTSVLQQAFVPNWRGMPTVRLLWFRSDYAQRRLKAWLCCLNSDTPRMLDINYVPRKYLLMCCVLRYLVAYKDARLLKKQELDAFLATSVSAQLPYPSVLQGLQMTQLTERGVTLANWFTCGVDHAVFANDACGSPIPPPACSPHLYFDGKLFQWKLSIAQHTATSLADLCEGNMKQMAAVERMRAAVLEGLEWLYDERRDSQPRDLEEKLEAVNKGRGLIGRREILQSGGQLRIAGQVVGTWGGQGVDDHAPKGRPVAPTGHQPQYTARIPNAQQPMFAPMFPIQRVPGAHIGPPFNNRQQLRPNRPPNDYGAFY